jgi:hypothetical protein
MRAGVLVREPLEIPSASQRAFSPAPLRKSLFYCESDTTLDRTNFPGLAPGARGRSGASRA